MLIEFRVENHRSIRSEQVLTLAAGRTGEAGDPRPRAIEGAPGAVLPAAALYGANASGKSNLLAALGFMRQAVVHSHRVWEPAAGVPRDPFAWGPAVSAPSLFEVTFVIEGRRFRYGFVADDERFLEEWLHAWPGKRKQVWFEREGDSYKFGEHLGGENRVVEQVTRPNALFLSAAAQHGHPQLQPLYGWFQRIRAFNVHAPARDLNPDPLVGWLPLLESTTSHPQQLLLREPETLERRVETLRDLLRAADVGIVDVKLEERQGGGDPGPRFRRRPRILVRHKSAGPEAWLPLEQESHGTITMFSLGPTLVGVLAQGGVLVIDELEASLHPLLALHVLRQFNDPATNPHNAQIVFSTHDTNLLGTVTGEPALRRDQIWLTEKDDEGATCVYPLTDYKPRKGENLERGYLQGRYGAIPFLGELARVEA